MELGELQSHFRKTPTHQQKNNGGFRFPPTRPGCRDTWKNVQNETTLRPSAGNTKVNILALTAGSKKKFVYLRIIS